MVPQTWSLLTLVQCCTFLKIMKRWSRWSSKAEVQQWDMYPEPSELRLIGYLTESTWTQRSKSNTLTTITQLADMLTKGNFTRDEWNHLLHLFDNSNFSSASGPQTMSKRMQQGTWEERIVEVEADAEPCFEDCDKLFYSADPNQMFECIKSRGDTQSSQSARLESQSICCRETKRWRFKSERRRVEFSSVAKRCRDERTCEETRCCRNEPGSQLSRKCKETCSRKFRSHRRRRLGVAEQLPHISCLLSTSRESTRICDSNLIASQKTKWKTSMWIRWYGECLWLSLCKQQFILEMIIW